MAELLHCTYSCDNALEGSSSTVYDENGWTDAMVCVCVGESLTTLAVTSSPAVGAGLSVTCIYVLSSLSLVIDLARLIV